MKQNLLGLATVLSIVFFVLGSLFLDFAITRTEYVVLLPGRDIFEPTTALALLCWLAIAVQILWLILGIRLVARKTSAMLNSIPDLR